MVTIHKIDPQDEEAAEWICGRRAIDRAVLAFCAENEGWRFVLCHGGGPQANALSDAVGLQTIKVGGRRVTERVLLGRVEAGEHRLEVRNYLDSLSVIRIDWVRVSVR